MSIQDSFTVTTATIANGTSLSDTVDLGGGTLVAYIMPAGWTAAGITFQAGEVPTLLNDVYTTAGSEVTHTVAASRFVQVSPVDFVGSRYIKVRSGTSGAAVNQGAERLIQLISRAV